MTIAAVLAYLLIVCYFVIERLLRKGEKALSLQAGASDRGSSRILWISGLFNILLVLFAPILNVYQRGRNASNNICRAIQHLLSENLGVDSIDLLN
jgi:hypothetical protein